MKISSDTLRLIVPVASLLLLLAGVFYLQPRAMSYTGLNLLFNLAVPIALATIAQMLIMAVNDLDLSMGTFVSFVACVAATFLHDTPLLGVLILLAAVAVYALMGVIIYVRDLPSIVVTLGMSFVWAGLAVLFLPAPGGTAPERARVDDLKAAIGADGNYRKRPADGLRPPFDHAILFQRADPRGRGQPAFGATRRLVDPCRPRLGLCAGGLLCRGRWHLPCRADHQRRCQYRAALHAAVDCRRDPWRR